MHRQKPTKIITANLPSFAKWNYTGLTMPGRQDRGHDAWQLAAVLRDWAVLSEITVCHCGPSTCTNVANNHCHSLHNRHILHALSLQQEGTRLHKYRAH